MPIIFPEFCKKSFNEMSIKEQEETINMVIKFVTDTYEYTPDYKTVKDFLVGPNNIKFRYDQMITTFFNAGYIKYDYYFL